MEKSEQNIEVGSDDAHIGKRDPEDDSQAQEDQKKPTAPEPQPAPPRKKLKDVLAEKLESAPSIIIDCDFASVQKERELKSMVVQISECLGLNKRAEAPFRIYLTGVHDKLREKLEKQYPSVNRTFEKWPIDWTSAPDLHHFHKKQQLVYLTGDSETEIQQLDRQ
jgi:Trm5-related predicted tRNA methylase